MEVDVLIGMDYYWDVVDFNSSRQIPSGLVESRTKLGPVSPGSQTSTTLTESTAETNSAEEFCESVDEIDRMIQHLLGLEPLEMKEEADETNASIIQHYYNAVQIEDGFIYAQVP
ncbi:hypothetical protein V3C99_018114 [Haemonchus contortus]|uniref:DUF1758 domain-containing protein n=1 Tax=Haemonchus contortus TaxID=6289 RepID=A0A7I5EEF9_HAECO